MKLTRAVIRALKALDSGKTLQGGEILAAKHAREIGLLVDLELDDGTKVTLPNMYGDLVLQAYAFGRSRWGV